MSVFRKILKGLIIFIVILIIWEAAFRMEILSSFVLPSPGKVFSSLIKMSSSGELWRNLYISIKRVLVGFLISCIISFILSAISAIFPKAVNYYEYFMGVIRHVPPISLIPLFILWFGIGETPKIIVIVLATIFPILLNTESGILGCDQKLCDVGRMMGFSKAKIFLKIMLPNAVPEIIVGMRLGLGYGWRAIVSAEMIAAASGLGYMILDAQSLSRTDKVMAGIIVIGLIGFITDIVCGVLEKKIMKRFGRENLQHV